MLQRDRSLPALALTLLLEALAEHCGARLLRVKGLVHIEEMPGRPAVIHGVQHVFSPPEFLDRWPSADHSTRLVFITQGVPRHFPARLLDAIEHEVREAMEESRVAALDSGNTRRNHRKCIDAASCWGRLPLSPRHWHGPPSRAIAKTLSIVPQVALNSIDPVWTSSQIARNMGFMVFDLLYGRDEAMNPRPQMVEGDLMEDGGRRWTLRLRENLRFHDGEPVRSRDCIASLRRWMVRDQGGVTLSQRLDAMEAPDDRTIVLRLNKPFPHLRTLLSKFIIPAVMMPERLALTDPFKQIPEAIGSGPFRWLADEHVLGSHAAFAKFDGYVPRDEPPSYTAGGHRVLVDRVEWKMIPDGATAANALVTGEVDWIEIPLPDLLPMLKKAPGHTGGVLDEYGQICFLRPNHMAAPTSNPGTSPRHAGRDRPAGGDGGVDGRRSEQHVHRRRLSEDRQEGGGRGRHGTGRQRSIRRTR